MDNNPYERDELLQQYLVFHYATATEQFPYPFGARDALGFPERCAASALDGFEFGEAARALDVGCAVGRSTFELARVCPEVIGIDFSQAFVDAASRLAADGRHPVRRYDEAEHWTDLEVRVDPAIERSRATFMRGDATCLPPGLGTFDLVLACNLICRLPDPSRFLAQLPDLVRPGGRVLITTPFTWLEAYTPRDAWLGLGGADSFDGLRQALDPGFEAIRHWDMPFLIREHARKFQYSVAQASLWQRR